VLLRAPNIGWGEQAIIVSKWLKFSILTNQFILLYFVCTIFRYSMPLDGHDRAPSWIPTRHLYQYFLPPWKKVINEVDTVMEDYTEVDGVPNVANRFTLNVLLRKTLDFDGLVVTDYNEIYNLFEWHHTASDRGDALKKALEEGTVDMSMIAKEPDDYFQAMNSFNSPQLMARIETSARRVLELKQKLNMFDEAFRIDDFNATEDRGPTNDDLKEALDMTTQSIVLVENKDNALPLDSEDSMKVLVTGPTSNSRSFQTGGWTFQWQGVDSKIEDDWFTYGSTVRDAIEEQENWEVTYECGTCILGRNCENEIPVDQEPNEDNRVDEFVGTLKEWVGWKDSDQDHLSIKRAMNQAENMDVIIVCIGEENYAEKPGDIRSLELPSGQYELVMGLRKTAPDAKIIVVVSDI
jgi:beta-glucosidase